MIPAAHKPCVPTVGGFSVVFHYVSAGWTDLQCPP